MNEYLPIKLFDYQTNHFDRILNIFSKQYICIDGSQPGAGKTWTSTKLGQVLNLKICTFCPKTIISNWENVLTTTKTSYWTYEKNKPLILTYETLRGKKGYDLKHGLLRRIDIPEKQPIFEITPKLKEMMDQGTLFIFDECQKLKNNNDISRAIRSIFRYLSISNSKSKIIMLSGSIANTSKHIINLLRAMQIITHRNLYTYLRGEYELHGINELFEFGRELNPELSNRIESELIYPLTTDSAEKFVTKYWNEVISKEIYSFMPIDPSLKINAKQYLFNVFYLMEDEQYEKYEKSVKNYSKALNFDENIGMIVGQINLSTFAPLLTSIQLSKISIYIDITKFYLTSLFKDKKDNILRPKIILYCDYEIIWNSLYELLSDFNPLLMTGKTTLNERKKIVNSFREINNEYRLLITNMEVGGLGVNLHDESGLEPVISLMMPAYKANSIHQAIGRSYRTGTNGVALSFIIYGKKIIDIDKPVNTILEYRIFKSLNNKGKFLKECHKDDNAIFPGEYPNITLFKDNYFIPDEWILYN